MKAEEFARQMGKPVPEGYRFFLVSEEIVDELKGDWSEPVRYKFIEDEDGMVEMLLQRSFQT